MFTILYRGMYIHGYCDRAEVKVMWRFCNVWGKKDAEVKTFRSMRAAKYAIGRYCNMLIRAACAGHAEAERSGH